MRSVAGVFAVVFATLAVASPSGAPAIGSASANPHNEVRPLSETSWPGRIRSARRVAARRHGRIAFALVDERGRLRAGQASGERFHSASVVKAMLLVAYLNDSRVRGRGLREADLDLLDPMVRRSGNRAASRVRDFVGNPALSRLARRARLRNFATAPSWGDTSVTAADMARLFFRIDRLVVRRHRATALRLLRTVIDRQRWGIPAVAPPGSVVAFKGGWRRGGGGRLVNQAALVQRGGERMAIAILTDGSRSHGYGVGTVERIARALLPR
jgi:hypothetical protein